MLLKTFEKQDYSGGLNSTASLREVAPNEATVLKNWDITYQGQLRRRDGLTRVGDASSGPILGAEAFIRDGGADMVRAHASSIEYLAGTVWTPLMNTLIGSKMVWLENVQALNSIFASNEDNQLMYWDRSSTTLNGAFTVLPNAPHGNVQRWYKNFLFHLNNVKVGSQTYSEDLFWSNLGDPTTYDTVNNHTKVPGDGKLITAVPMGTTLVLFKERSVQYLTGFGNASWQITGNASSYNSVSEEIGCIAPRGACQVGDEVWFIDNQARIRRITKTDNDAFRHDVISKKIQASLDGINKGQLSQAIAWSWNNKVYFHVPNGSDNVNSLTFVFDILASRRVSTNPYFPEEAWTTYDNWKMSCAFTYPSTLTLDLYMGDALSGKVYKHFGVDDDGVAINAIFEDGNNDFGLPDQFKNYKMGRITADAGTGDTNVFMDTSIDSLPYINIGTLNLLATGSTVGPTGNARCGPTGSARCGGRVQNELRYTYDQNSQYPLGKRIRHRIRHNGLGQQPIVNSYTSSYKPRALR